MTEEGTRIRGVPLRLLSSRQVCRYSPVRKGKGKVGGGAILKCRRWGLGNSKVSTSRVTRLTTVFAMACTGSSRLYARAEKLCQFGHFAQLRRKLSTTCVKSRSSIEQPTSTFIQHCQVFSCSFAMSATVHEKSDLCLTWLLPQSFRLICIVTRHPRDPI